MHFPIHSLDKTDMASVTVYIHSMQQLTQASIFITAKSHGQK